MSRCGCRAKPSGESLRSQTSRPTRLFVDRATAIDPAFKATEETAATIARICRRLDGIPLAIELAAARINALSVDQIDERLQDRFRLLTGGARTALARQRTLEATVQWSYQLLSEQERVLLSRLSVFPAGWTLEAAEKVCGGDGIDEGDMLDLLSRLVSKSLVTLESQAGADRRYRLLETVRHYARERLVEMGSADRLRGKHFEFFFNEFRGAQTALQGHEQVRWLKRLRLEQDSVRAALEWAIAPGTADKALELAGALFWYWTKRGAFAEGRQWLERALALNPDVRGSVRARALIGLGHMFYFQGHIAEVADLGAEALPLARAEGDTWATVFALFPQALAAIEQGNHESAATLAAAACEAARANELFAAGPSLVLGNLALLNGEVDRAQQLFDRSNDLNRRAGEIWGLGIGLLIAAGIRIFVKTSSRRVRMRLRRCRSTRSWRIHAGSRGQSKRWPGCSPSGATTAPPPGCGRPRTGFWRTPVCRRRRSSDGFAIVIRRVWKRHSGLSSCRPRWPRDARCPPRRRSRSRVTTSWSFVRISYRLFGFRLSASFGFRLLRSAVGYRLSMRFANRFSLFARVVH